MATPEHGEKIIDPIHQFVINRIIPIDIGGLDISFTNSALWAVIAVTCASLLFILAPRNLIPTRLQSVAESIYEVVDNMTHEVLHENARTYFPFVRHGMGFAILHPWPPFQLAFGSLLFFLY